MSTHIPEDLLTAYVNNEGSNSVTAIRAATNTASKPIPVGDSPLAIAVTPNGTAVHVVNGSSNTVTPIATTTNVAGTPVAAGTFPVTIAVTP